MKGLMGGNAIFFALALFLAGCANDPSDLDRQGVKVLDFSFPKLVAYQRVELYRPRPRPGGEFVKLTFQVQDKRFDCLAYLSAELADNLSSALERKRQGTYGADVIGNVRIVRANTFFDLESISPNLRIYGTLQYWLAYSWMSMLAPYTIAYHLSLLVPAVIFGALLIFFGQFFVEFEFVRGRPR